MGKGYILLCCLLAHQVKMLENHPDILTFTTQLLCRQGHLAVKNHIVVNGNFPADGFCKRLITRTRVDFLLQNIQRFRRYPFLDVNGHILNRCNGSLLW